MDIPNNDNETLSQTIVAPGEQQSIEMQDVCQTNDLDEILRRNENRCIQLTDSDDKEHVNFSLSMNRTTPPTIKTDELKSTTPKMPVRLSSSSSISNLISTSSLTSTCELAGRVIRQVRAFEQRSSKNIQNCSIVPTSTSTLSLQQKFDDSQTELTSKPSSRIKLFHRRMVPG
ncbi:unnamed protein product, partial [Rotaria socialis]